MCLARMVRPRRPTWKLVNPGTWGIQISYPLKPRGVYEFECLLPAQGFLLIFVPFFGPTFSIFIMSFSCASFFFFLNHFRQIKRAENNIRNTYITRCPTQEIDSYKCLGKCFWKARMDLKSCGCHQRASCLP